MTRTCDYCGNENDAAAAHCVGCGTPFPVAEAPTPSNPPRLDAKRALTILVLYLASQGVVTIIAGTIGTSLLGGLPAGESSNSAYPTFHPRTIGPALFLSMIGGGIAVLLTARKLVPDQLHDPEPSGAAWRIGERRNLLVGLGAGLGTCFTYVIIAGLYQYWSGHTPRPGPITALPNNGGLNLLLWLVMLVILAPLIEEALFRGVVFAGFQNSWGRAPGAILTSVAFWVLHLWDMAGFWPAMVGIASMSVLTLWLRLRYSAIGPAIAAHMGYNGFIAAVFLLSRLGEGR